MNKYYYLLIILLTTACTSAIVKMTPKNGDENYSKEKWSSISFEEINKGYILYKDNCNQCHKYYKPSSYADHKMEFIIQDMATKAKLNKEQAELIYKFIYSKKKSEHVDSKK